jgi:hypothetical protein
MRYSLIGLLLGLGLLLGGCATTQHVPITREMPLWPRGAWVTFYDARQKATGARGELLALTPEAMILLVEQDSTVREFSRDKIVDATIDFASTSDQPKGYGGWVLLNSLSTLTHGFVLILSLPINLIVGLPAATSARKAYHVHYPKDISWNEAAKFARFPQGLPEGLRWEQVR